MLFKVKNLYKNRKFKEILNVISADEKNLELLELRGIAALQLNQFEEVKETFTEILTRTSQPSHHYHLGLAYMNLGYFSKSINSFEEAQNDIQFKNAAKINIAHCCIKLKQFNKAEGVLIALYNQNKLNQSVLYLLFQVYENTRDIDKFKQLLNSSELNFKNELQWNRSKCKLLLMQKKFGELIQFIDMNSFDLTSYKVKALLEKGQIKQAIKIQKELINKDSDSALNWYNLGAMYSRLTSNKDLKNGLIALNSVLKINGDYADAFHCQSIIYQKLGDYTEAVMSITKAIALEQNKFEFQFKLAELLHINNELDQSKSILERLLEKDSNHQESLRHLGIIDIKQDNLLQARKKLNKAIELDDTDQRAISYFEVIKSKDEIKRDFDLVKQFQLNAEDCDLNLNLAKDIKNHSQLRYNPNGLAARNGYLTDNLFADQTPAILMFKDFLLKSINQYIEELSDDSHHYMLKHKTKDFNMNVWATWTQNEGYIDKHIHEESWISGSYYCSLPEITNSTKNKEGYFQYNCLPQDINIESNLKLKYLKPEVGSLIIFPSYVYHQTIPHNTNDDRISIAFDLTPKSWQV